MGLNPDGANCPCSSYNTHPFWNTQSCLHSLDLRTGSSLTPLPGLKVLQWNKKNWNPSTGLKRVGFFFPFKKAYTIIRNIGNAKTAFICMLNVKTTHILHARPENQTSNKIAPGVRAFRKSHSQKDLTKEFLYSPPLPLLALSRVSIPWQPFTP